MELAVNLSSQARRQGRSREYEGDIKDFYKKQTVKCVSMTVSPVWQNRKIKLI